MPTAQTQILHDAQVKQILRRIAYQVYETHFNEKELIIAGIVGRGYTVAKMLVEQLSEISKMKLSLMEVKLDKKSPSQDEIVLSDSSLKLEGKSVLLVDDVLNTGKTMIYALLPFLQAQTKSIHTVVLVDRDHKSFPVNADFIGISLSTTLQEHVTVTIEKNKVNVYLS